MLNEAYNEARKSLITAAEAVADAKLKAHLDNGGEEYKMVMSHVPDCQTGKPEPFKWYYWTEWFHDEMNRLAAGL